MGDILQAILAITLIDLAMSGDNALVIGMVARGLPRSQRRRAIVFGAGAAVVLRVMAAAAVTLLLTIQYLQLVGGLALVVIAYRLVRPDRGQGRTVREVTTLRAATVTILAADFAMSLENILGVGAAAHGNIALLLFGLGLSIPIVLFGSGIIGMGASILGIIVTFKTPWVTQWTTHSWRVWLAIIVVVSALIAIAIYAISEYTHRGEVPTPTPTPAG